MDRGEAAGRASLRVSRVGSDDVLREQLDGLPRSPGVYLFRDAAGRAPVRREGESAALARAQLLQPWSRHPSGDPSARRADRAHRADRHPERGRGAASRAEPRQAPPTSVQRAAARRQVVPVHRGDRLRRVPAGDVHARAASTRHRLLRPVRECEEGARDARRAQSRVPVPSLRGPDARSSLGHPVPRLPHRALHGAVHRRDLAGGLRRGDRRR